MSPKPCLLAATLLVSPLALAGVHIETVTRDIKTQKVEGSAQTVLVQNGSARVSSHDGNTLILKGTTIYAVDDKKKTYHEMDKAMLQNYASKANAAMAAMQEQLKNMPPEQRAQVEKMMGASMPGMVATKQDTYDSKATGKTDTVEGRKCEVYNMLKNGTVYEEVCVAPFSAFPGKEDLQQTFKQIADVFESFASAMPGAAKELKARTSLNGYPIRVRSIEKGMPIGNETVLKSWTEESLPASAFEVPNGYKKEALPNLGG